MLEFKKGFYEVIPKQLLSVFDCDELDFLLGGSPEINIGDWKSNTLYKGVYR
jgi:E3 ubiquitin-protein ligase HUWE1